MAGIHFQPELIGYNGQGAFRFWCQKVLPLVYDDSLSYYELLCKVVKYLNNTNEDVKLLGNSYLKLVEFVNGYFDNLDVTTEVNNKLDEMVESGKLDDVIASGVSAAAMQATEQQLPGVVAEQIDAVVAEQIDGSVAGQIDEAVDSAVSDKIDDVVESQIDGAVAGQIDGVVSEQIGPAVLEQSGGLAAPAVTNWLEQNVVPQGSAVVVDESLSVQGAAADALYSGTSIRALENEFVWDNSGIEFEVGGISSTTGEGTSAQHIRTVNFVENISEVKCNDGYVLEAYAYNKNTDAFVGGYRAGNFAIGESGQDTVIGLPSYYKYKIVLVYIGSPTRPTAVEDKSNVYFLIGTDTTLSLSNRAADAKIVGETIAEMQTAFDSCFDGSEAKTIDIRNITGIVGLTSYSATAGSTSITFSSNGSYNTYYVYLSAPLTLYYGDTTLASTRFVRLCTIENAQPITAYNTNQYIIRGSNPHEYNRASGNLPSESNPLTCQAGTALVFTEGKTSGLWELFVVTGLVLNDAQVENIAARMKNAAKKNYLKYIPDSGSDDSSERVEVYIPNIEGYIRYDFVHTEKASINADVWRVGYAYHTDDSYAEDYAITTAGEWECAIKLSGRSDFSGGHAHGNEVMQNITFIIDGKVATLSNFASMTPFSDLTIIEDSKLFDPNDGTTHFANHGSEHHFTSEGLTVRQSLKFVAPETVAIAYMAMLPIAKAVSNYIVPDSTFAPLATTEARRLYNTESVIVYKSDGNVKAVFEVPKFEYLNDSDYTFVCSDNNSSEYNKCYFCNTLTSTSVSSGKLMKSETKYKFIIS